MACRSTSTRSSGSAGNRSRRATAGSGSASRPATSSQRGALGDQALAVRVSGTELDARLGRACLWRAQPPADVRPAFHGRRAAGGVDAGVYRDPAGRRRAGDDARGLALSRRGFLRRGGAVDVTGQERTYGCARRRPPNISDSARSAAPTTSFPASKSWPTRVGTGPTSPSPPPCGPACGSPRPSVLPVQVDVGVFVRLGVPRPRRHRVQSRKRSRSHRR